MANTIKLKRGSGSDPSASDLEVGELAIRTDSGKIFTKKDNGNVAEISGGGGIDDGDKGDITISNGGDTFTIDSGVIDNANIASNAAIAGTKISANFGSQNIITNYGLHINQTNGSVFFGSSTGYGNNAGIGIASTNNFHISGSQAGDMTMAAKGGERIVFGTSGTANSVGSSRLVIDTDGTVNIAQNLEVAGIAAFGTSTVDPDGYGSFSGGFGSISDGSGWSARGVFVHGGGTGDVAAMAHNGSKLYFGIQNNASANSMETWLDVTPASRVINFQTDNNATNVQIGGNKIFHAGNDGAGSGLDSDLLDGQEGSYYRNAGNLNAGTIPAARLSASDLLTKIKTVDGPNSGLYADYAKTLVIIDTRNDGTRVPNDYDNHRVSVEFTNQILNGWHTALTVKGWTDGYAPWQLVGRSDVGQDTNLRVRFGHGSNNTWSSLYKIWHEGSDGSGSGLDADKLDAQEGSYYTNASNLNAGTVAAARLDTATTQSAGNSTTKIATTAFVSTAISNLIDSSPSTLNTLNELASALGDDPNFATTVTNSIATKLALSGGTVTGQLSLTSSSQYPLTINSSDNGKIVLAGSNSPYIRFQEGTTNKAYIQYSGGVVYLHNHHDSSTIRLKDSIDFSTDGSNYYSIWHGGNDGAGSGLDADKLDGVQGASFLRSDADDTATGTLTTRDIKLSAGYHLQRSNHHSGHLEGSYNNVGDNSAKSNPIYTIGSSYNPNDADLGTDMYGIGYTHRNASFISSYIPSADAWGLYIAADADSRVFLSGSSGNIWPAGVYGRLAHHKGHLQGSYNNIGANSYKSNPIYTIGGSYNPNDASLSNMYGVGYTHTNASFINFTGASAWGFYVAADGDARVFLDGSNGVVTSTGNHYVGSNRVLHVGDEGSGNGLDADTVDGIQASQFIRSDTDDAIAYNHQIRFYSNSAINTSTAYEAALEVFSGNGAGTDAFMAFHVSGDFAAYFGLDGGINDFAVGGWSMGANSYRVWHQGNDGSGSGLDADLLDGVQGANYVRTNQNTTITSDLFIGGGAGGMTVNGGSDIRFTNGDWTGNVNGTAKIQHHDNRLYLSGGTSGFVFRENNANRWLIDGSGHFVAGSDSSYDIGSNGTRVRNGYFDTLYGDGSNLTGINTDLVSDTSPQLGGTLDGNGQTANFTGNTTGLGLPRGSSAQAPTASSYEGYIRYDNDDNVVYYSDGSAWKKVSSTIPILTTIDGLITNGAASTLTLTGSGFLADSLTVNFSASGINANVTVTASSNSAATVTVPAAAYNASAGTVIAIKVTNADGNESGTINKTNTQMPTGGNITTSGNYRIHTFTSSGTFGLTIAGLNVEYLVVAGGGGGGAKRGGGGGAGGMISGTVTAMSTGNKTVTVGGGGGRSGGGFSGGNSGNNSVFDSYTAQRGGAGGCRGNGGSGGSGGGNGRSDGVGGTSGGSGTSGQGNNGGGHGGTHGGSGGGGKGSSGGGGGNGSRGSAGTSAISGTNTSYAEGGQGGTVFGTGGFSSGPGANRPANTGHGADGGDDSPGYTGGAGGSGIVIVRYQL